MLVGRSSKPHPSCPLIQEALRSIVGLLFSHDYFLNFEKIWSSGFLGHFWFVNFHLFLLWFRSKCGSYLTELVVNCVARGVLDHSCAPLIYGKVALIQTRYPLKSFLYPLSYNLKKQISPQFFHPHGQNWLMCPLKGQKIFLNWIAIQLNAWIVSTLVCTVAVKYSFKIIALE